MNNQIDFKQAIIDLLIEAKNQGLILHGDGIIGYFFKGENEQVFQNKLQYLADDNKQHWQDMSFDINEVITESGIKVIPYQL